MKKNLASFCLVIASNLLLGVYLKTLCPTIYLEDSGEFISAAFTLGINHPPGYPLVTLINRILINLPLGSIPFRVNLSGVLIGVIGVVIFCGLLRRFGINFPLSILGAALLGVSRLWWSQALQAEVYLLNGVIALIILSTLNKRNRRSLPFYLGLGLANHYLIITFAPLIYFVFTGERAVGTVLKKIVLSLFLVLLGLMVYLYLPVLGSGNPQVSWRYSPATWRGAGRMLSRRQFSLIEFSHEVTAKEKRRFIGDFLKKLAEQGTTLTLILAGLGLFWLFKHQRRWLLITVYLFLANSLAIILILRFPFSPLKVFTVGPYYLVAYVILFFFAAGGLMYLSGKKSRFAFALGLLVLALTLWRNGVLVNRRAFYLTYDFGRNMTEITKGRGVVMVSGIYELFPLMYFKLVESRGSKLTVLEASPGAYSRYRRDYPNQPLFLTKPGGGVDFINKGLLFRAINGLASDSDESWKKHLVTRGLFAGSRAAREYPEMVVRRYYSRIYLLRAEKSGQSGNRNGVERALEKVREISPELVIPANLF